MNPSPSLPPGLDPIAAKDRAAARRRRPLVFGAAVLVGAIILLVASEWGSLTGPNPTEDPDDPPDRRPSPGATTSPEADAIPPPSSPANEGITGGPTPVRAFGAPRIPPPTPEGARSPLADRLNAPDGTAQDDVAIVAELFANHVEVFRELPVGTNPEMTAALAGDNARGHAPLPADNPAITEEGELVDRWGTPFYFHKVSSDLIEIRSAGPDRRHWTADDVVWPKADGEGATLATTAR